jgi:hypothetical protein
VCAHTSQASLSNNTLPEPTLCLLFVELHRVSANLCSHVLC